MLDKESLVNSKSDNAAFEIVMRSNLSHRNVNVTYYFCNSKRIDF